MLLLRLCIASVSPSESHGHGLLHSCRQMGLYILALQTPAVAVDSPENAGYIILEKLSGKKALASCCLGLQMLNLATRSSQ